MSVSTVDTATALEADAEKYPDERGEILREAADAWRMAGQPERANALLVRLIEDGGEDGCDAAIQLAEAQFETGDDDEAYAGLDHLARDTSLHDGHCMIVAELLAEREDLPAALQWYDRAVARLSADQLNALAGPEGWMEMSLVMLRGRLDVRRQLGLPPDATDELALGAIPQPQITSVNDVSRALATGRPPSQVRMLVFQRSERVKARQLWPEEYGSADEEHYPAAENRWRELVASGVPAIRVVPATVAGLCEYAERAGESPLDPAVKSRYTGILAEQHTITWPPQRNAPCWCGSGTKYKKCCGRVS